MSIAEDFARANVFVNAHSSVRVACSTADGKPVIVYVDPFLMDAEHNVPEAPHDADLICFTHSHYDHFSPKDAAAAARTDGDTHYVMPASMVAEAVAAGVPCMIGRNGVEEIIRYDLPEDELEEFRKCCESIRNNMKMNDSVLNW